MIYYFIVSQICFSFQENQTHCVELQWRTSCGSCGLYIWKIKQQHHGMFPLKLVTYGLYLCDTIRCRVLCGHWSHFVGVGGCILPSAMPSSGSYPSPYSPKCNERSLRLLNSAFAELRTQSSKVDAFCHALRIRIAPLQFTKFTIVL